jgi:hypothetical protein
MQHPLTRFSETGRTPKKAADDCLFCFTPAAPRTRLKTR